MPKKHRIQKLPKFYQYNCEHLNDIFNQIDSFKPNKKISVLDNMVKNTFNAFEFPYASFHISEQSNFDLNNSDLYGCFRLRCFNSHEEALNQVNHVSKILSPPAHLVTDFGRCNKPSQSVLYCANNLIVGLAEINSKPGNFIVGVRLEQKLNEEFDCLLLGVDPQSVHGNPMFNPDNKEYKLGHKYDWQLRKQKMVERWAKKTFNARIAGRKKINYMISSAITDKIFYPEHPFYFNGKQIFPECIIYPSVKANLKSFNLAFKSDAAEKLLKITDIFLIRLESIENSIYSLNIITYGEIDDAGFISWNKQP